MARADLIIMNGLYLEIPTLKLAEANKRPDTPVLLLADRTLGEADYVFDFSYPKDQGHPNPHLWPDPVLVMNYARLVRDALTAADPRRPCNVPRQRGALPEAAWSAGQGHRRGRGHRAARQPPAPHLPRLVALLRQALRLHRHRRGAALQLRGAEPAGGGPAHRPVDPGDSAGGLRFRGVPQPGARADRTGSPDPLHRQPERRRSPPARPATRSIRTPA